MWAGDQIATIGNRGNSTGPHCHFEVLLNGTDRIDPVGGWRNGDSAPALLSVSVSDPDLPDKSDDDSAPPSDGLSAPKTSIIRRAPTGSLPTLDEPRTTHIGIRQPPEQHDHLHSRGPGR